MTRRRRTAEAAKSEILEIAERLLLASGPESVRLEAIARDMGVSHPTILYHFGSIEGVLNALHERISRKIRENFLGLLSANASQEDRVRAISASLKELARPENGRLLAWLVATGRDPFPPVEEQGMAKVLDALRSNSEAANSPNFSNVVLLAVLAMLGEAMVGDAVRARLGPEDSVPDRAQFRSWLMEVLGRELAGR
jgi:AcrR family transcriptional regulator